MAGRAGAKRVDGGEWVEREMGGRGCFALPAFWGLSQSGSLIEGKRKHCRQCNNAFLDQTEGEKTGSGGQMKYGAAGWTHLFISRPTPSTAATCFSRTLQEKCAPADFSLESGQPNRLGISQSQADRRCLWLSRAQPFASSPLGFVPLRAPASH